MNFFFSFWVMMKLSKKLWKQLQPKAQLRNKCIEKDEMNNKKINYDVISISFSPTETN